MRTVAPDRFAPTLPGDWQHSVLYHHDTELGHGTGEALKTHGHIALVGLGVSS